MDKEIKIDLYDKYIILSIIVLGFWIGCLFLIIKQKV